MSKKTRYKGYYIDVRKVRNPKTKRLKLARVGIDFTYRMKTYRGMIDYREEELTFLNWVHK